MIMGRLPNDTLKDVKAYQAQGAEHSAEEVDEIVQTLDAGTDRLYMRLDPSALAVLCIVLVRSETCLAQQRGLCLIKVRSWDAFTFEILK